MNWFESDTRNFDGSYKHLPGGDVLEKIVQRQLLPSEDVTADWQAPADITELLGRVYPDGAPEAWTRFFAGEEVEDAEREKIRVALKDHAQKPRDSGSLDDEILLRARQEIERGLQASAWLDLATEEDHWKMIRDSASGIATAVSARAALQMQKKSVDYLFELRGAEIRARLHRARDWHVLYLLTEAIIEPRRHTGFPDAYMHLLPAGTAYSIEWYKEFEAGLARAKRRAEEERRAEEAAEKERELAERLAFVEAADFDTLLDLLFGHNPASSILDSFRRREKLTSLQLDALISIKDTGDPIKRRGFERLCELGASVGIAVLTFEEIEELQARRLQEEIERKERETAARDVAIAQLRDHLPPKSTGTPGAVGY